MHNGRVARTSSLRGEMIRWMWMFLKAVFSKMRLLEETGVRRLSEAQSELKLCLINTAHSMRIGNND